MLMQRMEEEQAALRTTLETTSLEGDAIEKAAALALAAKNTREAIQREYQSTIATLQDEIALLKSEAQQLEQTIATMQKRADTDAELIIELRGELQAMGLEQAELSEQLEYAQDLASGRQQHADSVEAELRSAKSTIEEWEVKEQRRLVNRAKAAVRGLRGRAALAVARLQKVVRRSAPDLVQQDKYLDSLSRNITANFS